MPAMDMVKQLALQGLDVVMQRISWEKALHHARALDIGTALHGVGWSLGMDIDPSACIEAKHNAARNGVAGRVSVVAGTPACIGDCRYDVVLANLRPPTLVALMPRMAMLLTDHGYWILSGFRPDEMGPVERAFPLGIELQREFRNRSWAALVARRI